MCPNQQGALLKKAAVYLASLAIPTAVAFYLGIWLKGDLDLKYYRESILNAQRGSVLVDPEEELRLEVKQVFYKSRPFDSVHLIRFTLMNDDWQSLGKGAEFYFRVRGKPLPQKQVLGITCRSRTSTGDLVHLKRVEDPDLGLGLRLESDFPAHAQVRATLVVDTSARDSELAAAVGEVELLKKYRGRERLALATHPSEATITLPFWNAIIWCLAAACLYGGSWLALNIYLGNFSTGAVIVDFILRKLTGWSVIEWVKKRRDRGSQDRSPYQDTGS